MSLVPKIKDKLSGTLPGHKEQLKMMRSDLRREDADQYFQKIEQAKKAAVMLLLYQKNNIWHTALMQRPESPYPHSRQISLPGGRMEKSDLNLEAAAKRETEEEFGIPRTSIVTLGKLTDLYIPVSNFLVQPFVGYLKNKPIFVPDKQEVESIIEVPLDTLINPALRKKTDIKIDGGYTLKNIPYFDLQNNIVWGATAMILSEFSAVLASVEHLNAELSG